jgi:hypothetical protein
MVLSAYFVPSALEIRDYQFILYYVLHEVLLGQLGQSDRAK